MVLNWITNDVEIPHDVVVTFAIFCGVITMNCLKSIRVLQTTSGL